MSAHPCALGVSETRVRFLHLGVALSQELFSKRKLYIQRIVRGKQTPTNSRRIETGSRVGNLQKN